MKNLRNKTTAILFVFLIGAFPVLAQNNTDGNQNAKQLSGVQQTDSYGSQQSIQTEGTRSGNDGTNRTTTNQSQAGAGMGTGGLGATEAGADDGSKWAWFGLLGLLGLIGLVGRNRHTHTTTAHTAR